MRHSIYIILVLIVFATSCQKVLDIQPVDNLQNDEAITTPADLANVVEGVYDGLQNGLTLGGNRVIYADLFADDTQVFETNLSAFGTLEIYNRQMTPQIGDLRNMWSSGYSVINRANNVIKVIEEQTLNNHEEYDQANFAVYKATALFARAAVHFEMVRFWGQAYDVDNAGSNSQLGIPYRLQPTLTGPEGLEIARNSVEDVYNNALADFDEAISLIDTLGNGGDIYDNWYRHRVDQWALKAYKARILFFMGRYAEAASLSDEIINSGIYSLEVISRANFTQNGSNFTSEQIFQLISIAEDQSGNPSWAYSRFSNPIFTADSTAKWLFHSGDRRLNNTEGYFYGNFFGDTTIAKYDLANAFSGINMTVLRLSEVYLNAAEAHLSGSTINLSRAADLYSELYEARTGSIPTIPSTADSLLSMVQLERRLELMFEGDRYHNLKRMKQPLRNGVPYTDPSLLFKIPQEEMSGNNLMEQNP